MVTPASFRRPPGGLPPAKFSPNSLFRNILHVSLLFPIFCTGNAIYPHENKDLRREGGGGYATLL